MSLPTLPAAEKEPFKIVSLIRQIVDYLNSKLSIPVPVSSGGTGQTTEAEALGEMIQALTADGSPDTANDYVATYDASDDTGKKVLLSNISTANAVTAASTFGTDNTAIRADGTSRGAQSSPLIIADTTGDLSRSGGGGIDVQGTNTNDDAASGEKGEILVSRTPGTNATVTISNASPAVVSWTGHGLNVGSGIQFSTTGALPNGLSTGTAYYVSTTGFGANSFSVSTSIANAFAGTNVNTSSAGSGTHTGVAEVPVSNNVLIDVAGIQLTAGDWDVNATYKADAAGATVTAAAAGWVSTTSATFPVPQMNEGAVASLSLGGAAGSGYIIPTGTRRFSVNATTTIFLSVLLTFSVSTMNSFGLLRARRVR